MTTLLWFIGALIQAIGMMFAIAKNDIAVIPVLFTMWFICIYSYLYETYNDTENKK